MEKEIRSKENIELLKGKKEVRVKTTIDNLRTYNERIIKENIYLTTPENAPYDFYIKTEKGNNIGYIKINEDGPETYTIEKDTILGHLVEESNINKIR
ncbi:MAG: hypothetical protein ACI4PE_00225 [Bacilli bacterium]